MKINRVIGNREQIALNLLYVLAQIPPRETMTVRELSQRTGISMCYIESILRDLRAINAVRSFKGPHGGYALAKEPMQINVGGVFAIARSDRNMKLADKAKKCRASRYLDDKIRGVFESDSLQDVIDHGN